MATETQIFVNVIGAAAGRDGVMQAVTAGSNILVDDTNPANPIISADGLQPLDDDLTQFGGLSPSNNDVLQRKTGAWVNRTPAQLKSDLSLTSSDVGLGNVDNTSDATRQLAFMEAAYPVGSIYINATVSTNPGTLMGFGTWAAFGAGRVLVGINSSDADFDTVEETGGSKTNTHNHWQTVSNDGTNLYSTVTGASPRTRVESKNRSTSTIAATAVNNTREDSTYDETISIMPPYIVVYMWKRTA